jgi:hypothetical protein
VEFNVWLAPDLACKPLKEIAFKRDWTGETSGHFERSAVEIVVGEPIPALFDIPSDFREVPPSSQNRAIFEAMNPGRSMSDRQLKTMELMEKRYEAAQAHRR